MKTYFLKIIILARFKSLNIKTIPLGSICDRKMYRYVSWGVGLAHIWKVRDMWVGWVGWDMWVGICGGGTARPGSLPPPHVAIYRISVEGLATKDVWGGVILFLESIIRLWHICRTNIEINYPLHIISGYYTEHLY